jgi:hypothetical protein
VKPKNLSLRRRETTGSLLRAHNLDEVNDEAYPNCLIPCNAVVREISPGKVSIELMKPSAMMEVLGGQALVTLSHDADDRLKLALEKV